MRQFQLFGQTFAVNKEGKTVCLKQRKRKPSRVLGYRIIPRSLRRTYHHRENKTDEN